MIASAFTYFHKKFKGIYKILFGAFVLLVAFSRLYLGMHFPSDVIVGIVIGLVIGYLNIIARNKLFHRNFKPSKLEDEFALIALVVGALLAVAFLRSLPMAGIFVGFYAGFFLFKEMSLDQSILLNKMIAIKYAIGFGLLGIVFLLGEGFLTFELGETQKFVLYMIAGFWISWLWPVIWEKVFKRI